MKVDFNGLRKNIARAFNDVVRESEATPELADLRQAIAFLLLVYDKSEGWEELNPDELLSEVDYENE